LAQREQIAFELLNHTTLFEFLNDDRRQLREGFALEERFNTST
jgi:hypothetical protein